VASAALHDLLIHAIREKRLIAFHYKHPSDRIVEPHDYGVIASTARLLGYQITGQSSSGASHGWKMFDVGAMKNLRLLDRTFPGSRATASQQHIEWDCLFARV